MTSVEQRQLALLTQKSASLMQALSAAGGDAEDTSYKQQEALINKIYKKGVKRLRAESAEDKELTEKAQALADLNLTGQTYAKAYEFDTVEQVQTALQELASDWVTGKCGRHGGNMQRQHHGGPRGCFMITADKTTKIATLWVADTNTEDLPDDMDGAREISEDSDEPEEEESENEGTLALLIASAGKTVADIKAMDDAAREAHATKCNADRAIKAAAIQVMALKMRCPETENTKGKRLSWIFKSLD